MTNAEEDSVSDNQLYNLFLRSEYHDLIAEKTSIWNFLKGLNVKVDQAKER